MKVALKRLKTFMLAAILVATSIAISSCTKTITEEDITSQESSKESTVSMLYLFDDIPVPQGFKIDKEKSFIYRAGNQKSGILYLVGGMKPKKVKEFYLENLPAHGWKLLNLFEWKETFMNFMKEGWILNIQISPKWESGSQVKIMIGPTESPGKR